MDDINDNIYNMALALLGDVPDSAVSALAAVCRAAAGELEGRLKAGVAVSDIGDEFTTAAGLLAISMYVLAADTDGVSSFRAGDVSVSRRGAGAARGSASALRRQAETMLAAYLIDSGFSFTGVRS